MEIVLHKKLQKNKLSYKIINEVVGRMFHVKHRQKSNKLD